MNLSVKIEGYEALQKKFGSFLEIALKLQDVMLEIILQIQNDAKEFVTGRTPLDQYQKQAAAESKTATAIGVVGLGVREDNLRQNIVGVVEDITLDYISAVVSVANDVAYARIHELGGIIITKYAKIHMPARPYLYAALLKNKEFINKRLAEEIKKILG